MPCRVLLVEDHEDLSRLMVSMIERCDCTVIGPAASVADALALIEGGGVEAALVDQGLPDGPGTAVVRTLMERGIPCCVLSGYHRDDELDRGLEQVPWLVKPVEEPMLVRVLAELCGAADPQRRDANHEGGGD